MNEARTQVQWKVKGAVQTIGPIRRGRPAGWLNLSSSRSMAFATTQIGGQLSPDAEHPSPRMPLYYKPTIVQKKIRWITGGMLLVILFILLIVPVIAGRKLDALIGKANEEGNQLSIGKRSISFRLTYFNLEADSIRFQQTRGGQRYAGTVDRLKMNGLKLFPLLFRDRVDISKLQLDQPNISLRTVTKDTTESAGSGSGAAIRIGELKINNGNLDRYSDQGDLTLRALGLQLTSTALQLPLEPAAAPTLLFQSDSLLFPKKRKAEWSINDVKVDSDQREIRLGTLRLSPRQALKPYLASNETRDDWMAVRFDNILFSEVPFDSLLRGSITVIPTVTVEDFNLLIFEDTSLPEEEDSKTKVFPVEQFRNLPIPAQLKKLTVRRANITYGMTSEEDIAPTIRFRDGNFSLGNFSTYPQQDSAIVMADFTFGDSSPLNARFALDQSGSGRHFAATGQLKNYDLTDINPFMLVAAEAIVEGGYLNELRYDFTIENDVANGKLLFLYQDLELKLEGKAAWLKNILEDVAVRDSNPRPDGERVHGTVYTEHPPEKSFFNLYWKSIVSGLQSSVTGKVFTPKELKATEPDS